MSNIRKWGAALALVALVAAASPASYRYLSGSKSASEPVAGSPEARSSRDAAQIRFASKAADRSAAASSSMAPVRGTASGKSNAGSSRLGVMPRNALPGGGFSYNPSLNVSSDIQQPAAAVESSASDASGTFIVIFDEPSLATYQGGVAGILMAPRQLGKSGKARIDLQSQDALNYLGYLQGRQMGMEEQMAGAAGRALEVRQRMQHAVNGIIVDMTPEESRRVAKLPGVRLVEGYREYVTDTDVGPTLIGAPAAWAGSVGQISAANPVQGEGVILGIIDSGINFGSPSFAGVDPVDGYVHVNPFGAGVYLGTCDAGGVDDGRCNSKLVGGYDFVCGAPANQCGVANIREEPGFGDTNGHGSHTASTSGGNRRDVTYTGAPLRISGVAPRANIIAYDVCYFNTATGQGLCPNVSTVAAINQSVADGVDVINYSIGGGASPWAEATSLAFLAATDAGVYVATSAGNSGPGPNTMGHLEPWTSSTAASQHGRGAFGILMQVTGPAPVPAALQPVVMNAGSGGVSLAATIPGTTALVVSPEQATVTDGCAGYPAGTFTGAIALVRRGGCSFTIKTDSATAAGAIAVVIANNAAGGLIPSVPGTTIPAFGVTQADGDLLAAFGGANPTATAQITFPAIGLPNVADALASFSSRGPAGSFNLIKPDLTAPGVSILAAISGDTLTGFENSIDLYNGTSMASPHNAGAAALIRQARPGWSVAEIKSALQMTATTQVLLEDQVSPADPFARGAGRIRIERAIRAGLVLNESTANFQAADPNNGGFPKTLNIASMAQANCSPSCSFTRTFRNAGTSGSLWSVSLTGLNGTLSSSLVWVPVGASRSITVTIDSSAIPANNTWNFGELVLTQRLSGGQTASDSTLSLPIGVTVVPPVISLPNSLAPSVVAGNNGSSNFNVGNIGGSTLNYTASTSGSGAAEVYLALRGAINSGFRNTIYTNPATANSQAQFTADDFDLPGSTQLTSLAAEGFVVSGAAFPGAATNLTWSIYPDAAGNPAGNPQTAAGAAVWTYTTTPTGTGVSTAGGILSLNLTAAGQNVVLPAGKYWLVINTTGTFANRWAQFASVTGDGSFRSITIDLAGAGAWANNTAFAGMNMTVKGQVTCGAPWLGAITPASGSLAPSNAQATVLTYNSSALAPASYLGYVCFSSNDPVNPAVAVRVNLTVTPPAP